MEYATTDHLTKEQAQEQGSFYTPKELSIKMAKMLNIQNKPDLKVLDPCVGKGNLLLAVLDVYPFVKNENLYGIDIDLEAIKYCKEKFPEGHFICADVLEAKNLIEDENWWKIQELETEAQINNKIVNKPKTFSFGSKAKVYIQEGNK